MLIVLGHPAAVLDGGLPVWAGPLEGGEVIRPPAAFTPRPWPFEAVVDATTGRFLAREELRRRYEGLGVVGGEAAVVYCGSGVTSCHDLLAIELAGLGRPRLYVGSWSAWGADPARPPTTGPSSTESQRAHGYSARGQARRERNED